MFLNQLMPENKEKFLKICVHAALSNGVFAEEEKETLAGYCREMDIDVHIPETPETLSELAKSISENSTVAERNCIVFETLALVKSDGVYDEREQEFMKELIVGLDISDDKLSKYIVLLDKYIELGKELYAAVTE